MASNYFFNNYFFLLIIYSGISCNASKLPVQMPVDLKIELYDGGGMMDISESIYISAESSYIEYNHYRAINKVYIPVSKKELEQLYRTFVENKFDHISTYESETYDRGGTTIYLRWKDNDIDISNSGSTYIENSDEDNYNNIVDSIYKLVNSKVEIQKQNLSIVLDKNITDLNKIISYSIDESLSYNSERDGIIAKNEIKILKGEHHLEMYLTNNTQPSYNRKNHASLHSKINIDEKHAFLYLSFENDSIKYRLE
jgi:hypothetical protein